jgi:NADH-quinone oxidoreductase subunit F
MPALKHEIASAEREGIQFVYLAAPLRFAGENGQLRRIICQRMVLGDFDAGGRRKPMPSLGDTFEMEVDQVILAIGQATDLSFIKTGDPLKTREGLIVVDEETLETGMPGVYAGGDVTKTPGAVIHAIAVGRKAAAGIDKALGGSGDMETILFERPAPTPHLGKDAGFADWPREPMPEIHITERRGFTEIARGYDAAQARKEASRCLQCDLRLTMGCNPSPPIQVLAFTEEQINTVPETEGVFQLLDEDHDAQVARRQVFGHLQVEAGPVVTQIGPKQPWSREGRTQPIAAEYNYV